MVASDTDQYHTGNGQSVRNLCDRTDSDHITAVRRKASLDEFFLVLENLDEFDQFILGRDFVRNFDVTIDLKEGLISNKVPQRKYAN